MQPRDYALEFVGAADNDLYVVDRLIGDQAAPDTMVGFHSQQAAEKLLKAVLVRRGVHFPKTHSLAYLIDLVTSSGTPVPTNLQELVGLQPFAVLLRYEPSPVISGFDRQRTRQLLGELRAWATAEAST